MDLRDLRYFEIAVTEGHLGRAAAKVHRSQPALTKSLQRLEAEAGVPLFDRSGRALKLTEAGQVLLRRARMMQRAMDELSREIKDVARGLAGHVRIGASATAADYLLPRLTTALVRETSAVTLEIAVRMNDALCAALKQGQLDLVICPVAQRDPELESFTLARDPVVVVASRSHPVFAKRASKLADLCAYRWVLPSQSAASRRWLDQAFREQGLPTPVAQIESEAISLTPRLVSGTEFLSFISRRNLGMDKIGSTLREVPVRAAVMQRDFAVLWRLGSYLSPATLHVRELLRTHGKAYLRANRKPLS